MCEYCCETYNYFPSQIYGGQQGDFIARPPVTSCKWAEWRLVSIANSTIGDAKVFISGDAKPSTNLPWSGTLQTLSDDTFRIGEMYFATFESGIFPAGPWNRITDSQKRVFIHIDDAGSGTACYVTLQFRVKLLTSIPGIIETVHPEMEHQKNIERSAAITQVMSGRPAPK